MSMPNSQGRSNSLLTVDLRVSKLPLKDLHEGEIKITPSRVDRLKARQVRNVFEPVLTHDAAWLVDHDEFALSVLVQYLDGFRRDRWLVPMNNVLDPIAVTHDGVRLRNLSVDSSHARLERISLHSARVRARCLLSTIIQKKSKTHGVPHT
jgi:hypothetical protein